MENGVQLPIGLQLLGQALDEGRILQIAHAYEQSTEWHTRRPRIGKTSNPSPTSNVQL